MKMRLLPCFLSLIFLAGVIQPIPLFAGDEIAAEKDLTRIRKKVEALRIWQLTEELDLDDQKSSKLFPAMKEADRERWRLETRNRNLVREMSRALEEGNPDPGKMDRILDELQSNRSDLTRVEERHMERVRQILSPADAARYVMFQVRFQRQIKQKAARAFRERRVPDDKSDRRLRDQMDDRDWDDSMDGESGRNSGGSRGGGGGRR